jgi:hypothetical protein
MVGRQIGSIDSLHSLSGSASLWRLLVGKREVPGALKAVWSGMCMIRNESHGSHLRKARLNRCKASVKYRPAPAPLLYVEPKSDVVLVQHGT